MYTYFIGGAKNIKVLFRNSRNLTSDSPVLQVYKKAIGLSAEDLAIFEADNSGSSAIPYSNVPEKDRIWHHVHDAQSRNLKGDEELGILMKKFTEELLNSVDKLPLNEWKPIPLYHYYRNTLTTA